VGSNLQGINVFTFDQFSPVWEASEQFFEYAGNAGELDVDDLNYERSSGIGVFDEQVVGFLNCLSGEAQDLDDVALFSVEFYEKPSPLPNSPNRSLCMSGLLMI